MSETIANCFCSRVCGNYLNNLRLHTFKKKYRLCMLHSGRCSRSVCRHVHATSKKTEQHQSCSTRWFYHKVIERSYHVLFNCCGDEHTWHWYCPTLVRPSFCWQVYMNKLIDAAPQKHRDCDSELRLYHTERAAHTFGWMPPALGNRKCKQSLKRNDQFRIILPPCFWTKRFQTLRSFDHSLAREIEVPTGTNLIVWIFINTTFF